ncbi:hypothetical protein [Rhodopseudomonas palustris]|uniref:Uncharacterized protein n=1 Tax=Rhodopseudomonas palustris (strain DX-1) TaxID=652103 RepID=E6VD86_RHOPX|nr:hypothetical protein [Rhodopseudomonas palustris]QDL99046.1 hypothetical protein FLL57_17830 [Rhodopseudomonas palustris]
MTASRIALLLTAVTLAVPIPAVRADTGEPWMLSTDTGYGYTRDGKTMTYRMGTNNAKDLFKGAKKVPRETLFFMGANGQLYMRSGPFLEGDGHFRFGADQ